MAGLNTGFFRGGEEEYNFDTEHFHVMHALGGLGTLRLNSRFVTAM